jgi:hypothetical protein
MEGKTGNVKPNEFYIHDIHQTHHPYINVSQALINPAKTNLSRALHSINPFSYKQIPSQDSMALGLRYGNRFFSPDIFPNYVTFQKWFPTHYDPLGSDSFGGTDWSKEKHSPAPHSHFAFTAEKLPRGCIRTIQNYKRCQMVNGDAKCKPETQDVVDICPNWALDGIKERTRWTAKVSAIQNNQYFNAMKESEYNKGRTVAEVSDKTWIDGTRLHLRPDTMWADERYGKITQAEINEAKKRVADREAHKAHGHGHGHDDKHGHAHGGHHYDFKHIQLKEEKPLYP